MSEADVPTVRLPTITVPALLRISPLAAVPEAEAVADRGTPASGKTSPETVLAGLGSVIVARTPVAPDKADVPMTRVPAEPAPVAAANTFESMSALTTSMRPVRVALE